LLPTLKCGMIEYGHSITDTWFIFVFIRTVIGTGASVTGFIFSASELNSLEVENKARHRRADGIQGVP
jgi:hypothetical protein